MLKHGMQFHRAERRLQRISEVDQSHTFAAPFLPSHPLGTVNFVTFSPAAAVAP